MKVLKTFKSKGKTVLSVFCKDLRINPPFQGKTSENDYVKGKLRQRINLFLCLGKTHFLDDNFQIKRKNKFYYFWTMKGDNNILNKGRVVFLRHVILRVKENFRFS